MDVDEIIEYAELIQERAAERIKSKSKSESKTNSKSKSRTSLLTALLLWEERFWTTLVFLIISFIAFLYLSDQSFVITDEVAVFKHSQNVLVERLKNQIGHYTNGYITDPADSINSHTLIALERTLKNEGNQVELLVSIVKKIKEQRNRINELKRQRRISPNIQSVVKCAELKTILHFRNCFRTEDASSLPTIPYSHIYAQWIQESFNNLLTQEIAPKLEEILVAQAKAIKRHLGLTDKTKESLKEFQAADIRVKRIQSALNETIRKINEINFINSSPSVVVPTYEPSFSSKTMEIQEIYTQNN